MAKIARKSDGRRIFTNEFKREQIDRVLRGELTLAELSRKLGIARSLLQRWKRAVPGTNHNHNHPDGNQPDGDGVSRRVNHAGELRADEYIRQLQLLLGKQAVELELLRAKVEELKKARGQ